MRVLEKFDAELALRPVLLRPSPFRYVAAVDARVGREELAVRRVAKLAGALRRRVGLDAFLKRVRVEFNDATSMYRAYADDLFRFDQLYRHFWEAADLAQTTNWDALKSLRTFLEPEMDQKVNDRNWMIAEQDIKVLSELEPPLTPPWAPRNRDSASNSSGPTSREKSSGA